MSSMFISPRDNENLRWRTTICIQLFGTTVLGIFASLVGRYLFGDGSLFLLGILERQTVADFFPTRYFAHFVTQFPAVTLITVFGCRDISAIGMAYGLSLFLTPVLGLVIVWWAARTAPKVYLAFPLLSHSILCMTGAVAIYTEDVPAAWLFWCIFYLLLFSKSLTLGRTTLLILCSCLATRTYESYILLAWLPIFVASRRGAHAYAEGRYVECGTCAASAGILLYSVFISGWSTLYPRDAENRSSFADALWEHLRSYSVQFTLLVMLGVALILLFPRLGWKSHGLFWTMVLVTGVTVGLGPLLGFHEEWKYQHISRVQGLYVPFLLGLIVLANPLSLRDEVPVIQSRLRNLVLWTCVVAFCFQWNTTLRWTEYRADLISVLSQNRGLISYHFPRDRLREFDWSWSLPTQTLLLSAMDFGAVRSLICVPEGTPWQPFDPARNDNHIFLAKYGVDMDIASGRSDFPRN